MPRFLMSWLLGLGANAIALILAAFIFPGFTLTIEGFVIALIVFAVLSALLPWLVLNPAFFHGLLMNHGVAQRKSTLLG